MPRNDRADKRPGGREGHERGGDILSLPPRSKVNADKVGFRRGCEVGKRAALASKGSFRLTHLGEEKRCYVD